MSKKPNIIVIMTDEHDPGVTGCYGDPIVQTPHIDKLAREGVTFDNCYTTSPLCVPARLSFTAGKYISRVSAWNNSWKLSSDDIPSVPHLLNAAGYDTVLCGKMHYVSCIQYPTPGRDGESGYDRAGRSFVDPQSRVGCEKRT